MGCLPPAPHPVSHPGSSPVLSGPSASRSAELPATPSTPRAISVRVLCIGCSRFQAKADRTGAMRQFPSLATLPAPRLRVCCCTTRIFSRKHTLGSASLLLKTRSHHHQCGNRRRLGTHNPRPQGHGTPPIAIKQRFLIRRPSTLRANRNLQLRHLLPRRLAGRL